MHRRKQVRRELGLEPGDEVDVVVQDGVARIVPAGEPRTRGQRVVEALLGKGDVELSTDGIMEMIPSGLSRDRRGWLIRMCCSTC